MNLVFSKLRLPFEFKFYGDFSYHISNVISAFILLFKIGF